MNRQIVFGQDLLSTGGKPIDARIKTLQEQEDAGGLGEGERGSLGR